MNVLLFVLAVIVLVAVVFFLLRSSGRKGSNKRHPYTLDSLSNEELMWLLSAYKAAISPETGTFRGGGVWRQEASPAQQQLLAALFRGRLNQDQLDMLIDFVTRAGRDRSNPLADEVLKKLYRIQYSGNFSGGTGAVV